MSTRWIHLAGSNYLSKWFHLLRLSFDDLPTSVRKINYLFVTFQNTLLILEGPRQQLSQMKNYFNFSFFSVSSLITSDCKSCRFFTTEPFSEPITCAHYSSQIPQVWWIVIITLSVCSLLIFLRRKHSERKTVWFVSPDTFKKQKKNCQTMDTKIASFFSPEWSQWVALWNIFVRAGRQYWFSKLEQTDLQSCNLIIGTDFEVIIYLSIYLLAKYEFENTQLLSRFSLCRA